MHLFSTDVSPEFSFTCPIAHLTFPPGWVTNPKPNYWSSPIPTRDALFTNFIISVNRNIFLLVQAKHAESYLTHLFFSHSTPICTEIMLVPSVKYVQNLTISYYLHFYHSALALTHPCLDYCSNLLNNLSFHPCYIVSTQLLCWMSLSKLRTDFATLLF